VGTTSGDFLDAILLPDAEQAERVASEALTNGWAYEDICLRMVQPAMHEVGRLWQSGKVSVAQEHLATAVSQNVLARSYSVLDVERKGRMIVACSPPGEFHGLGLRMVADFAQRAGWDVFYLGTSVPLKDLVAFVQDREPEVVAISTSLAISLPATKEAFDALHSCEKRPYLLAGGNAYGGRKDAALSLGADAFATDAREARELLDVI
jgi:methanogenic corrinoid protein MtbC1